MAKKTIFITGASSGFGNLAAIHFAKNNWNVIATMRSPAAVQNLAGLENILCLKLDVTDEVSIEKAVSLGIEKFSKIDVLVNNAGYGAFGAFEAASEKEIQSQLDVNLIGLIRVTQEVLPHMRREKSGLIINISSMAGIIGVPGSSIYNASKFAVEGLSEALRGELKDFGISVQLIEPGAFATGFGSAVKFVHGRKSKDFADYQERFHKHLLKVFENPPGPFSYQDPAVVIKLIYDCATGKNKKFRNPVGKDAKLMIFLKMILPSNVMLNMMQRLFRMK